MDIVFISVGVSKIQKGYTANMNVSDNGQEYTTPKRGRPFQRSGIKNTIQKHQVKTSHEITCYKCNLITKHKNNVG